MLVCVQYGSDTRVGYHAFPENAEDAVAWLRTSVDDIAAQKFKLGDWRSDMYCKVTVHPNKSGITKVCSGGSIDAVWAELIELQSKTGTELKYANWIVRILKDNGECDDEEAYWV